MHKQKSLRKNFILNSVLTLSSILFPLITFPYFSRILLPEGMGKVSFASSLMSYFVMFAQLGIPTYGIKACAQARDHKLELTRTVHELFFINLIMTVLSYGIFTLALCFVPRLQGERTLYLVMSLSLVCNAFGMEWFYQALEEYGYITARSIACRMIALIAMLLMVHTAEDYVLYSGLSVLVASASNMLNFFRVRKYIDAKPVGGYRFKRHWRPVATFFAMSVATTVYTNLDTVMLGFMTTDTDVGYYYAAVKVKGVLLSLVTSLGAVLLPRVSYYVKAGKEDEFVRITRKALNFVIFLALPLTVYFILFAERSILLLSGPAFAGAILPMRIIMPTLLCIGITNVLGIQILVPLGKEKIVLYSELAGAAVDLLLNALLIPSMASAGAAIGTLAAEIVVLAVQYASLKDELTTQLRRLHIVQITVAVLLGAAASIWVAALPLGNFFVLALSAGLFFGVYGSVLLLVK